MGLPYIQLEPSILKHPRLLKVAREIGVSKVFALAHINAVWLAAAELYESGDLGVVSDFELEAWAEWTGEVGVFAKAFRASWMDGDVLHGWKRRYGKVLVRRKADRRRWQQRADDENARRRKTNDQKKKRPENVAKRSATAPRPLRDRSSVKGKGKGKGKGNIKRDRDGGMSGGDAAAAGIPVPVPSSDEDPSSHPCPCPHPVKPAEFLAFWESSRVAAHRWQLILEALGPDLRRFAAEVAAEVLTESRDRRNPQSYATRIIRSPTWLRERAARREAAHADSAEAERVDRVAATATGPPADIAALVATVARGPPATQTLTALKQAAIARLEAT